MRLLALPLLLAACIPLLAKDEPTNAGTSWLHLRRAGYARPRSEMFVSLSIGQTRKTSSGRPSYRAMVTLLPSSMLGEFI
jgi:hypothetical protein